MFMVTGLGMMLGGLWAGWLVSWLADTLPTRQDWRATWRWPFERLKLLPATSATQPRPALWRYLLIWLAAILLGWLAVSQLGQGWAARSVAVQAWFFLAVAVIDLEHRLVLNRMVLAALPVLLLIKLVAGFSTFTAALLGGLAGFGVFLLIALLLPGGMGMGDVKLAGLIGVATGLAGIVPALMIGIFAGGIASIVILAAHRFRRGQHMAYAPYLVIGAWVVLFTGLHLVL
ncbi:MAG: prepilin peptidase [Caldilineaceae bacterium]|nr:prepilin peptidase [Caldilineaceae bacterium]